MTERQNRDDRPADAIDNGAAPSRTEQMIAIIDHCTAAKALADGVGNRFLAYLLAMTIEETRSALRSNDGLATALIADAKT